MTNSIINNHNINIVDIQQEDGNGYLNISINDLTMERLLIKGNADFINEELFNTLVEEIKAMAPDRFLIFTGDNTLGTRFAVQLQELGKVVLLLPHNRTFETQGTNILLVHTERPELDYVKYLDHVSLSGESREFAKEEEKQPPTTYFDESSLY